MMTNILRTNFSCAIKDKNDIKYVPSAEISPFFKVLKMLIKRFLYWKRCKLYGNMMELCLMEFLCTAADTE